MKVSCKVPSKYNVRTCQSFSFGVYRLLYKCDIPLVKQVLSNYLLMAGVGLSYKAKLVSISYWLQDGANSLSREGAHSHSLRKDIDIGSGITGSSAPHHLAQQMKNQRLGQLRVVVLEARDFCESHAEIDIFHQVLAPLDAMVDTSLPCHFYISQ